MQNQEPKSKPATPEQPTDEGLDETACSQLVVMRSVFETITKEMAAMERIEAKAAEDRHWSMADAMKNKRLAYDSALGFAMRGIEQAFSSANVDVDAPAVNATPIQNQTP
jgi:hypothetical protein